MQSDFVFSSESVTAGHPDKLCDQISDALVDRYLRQDLRARVSAECAISTGILFLSLKAGSEAHVDAPACAREVLRDVGYAADEGFDARGCTIMTSMYELPETVFPRISEEELGEAQLEDTPARDQTTVFGYACRDTESSMPLPIWLAHRLARQLGEARRDLSYLSPDGKVQVAVEYRQHRPYRIHGVTLVVSQHKLGMPSVRVLTDDIRSRVVELALSGLPIALDARTSIAINPEGPIAPGGPALHAGLTGRKTAVDGYGDFGRHGSGALSGKDPSRIDRIGSYAARHVARNVVASGLAERCEIQLSYSMGLSHPVSVLVETFGTGSIDDTRLAERVIRVFDLRPAGIVKRFGLRSLPRKRDGTFYRELAAYGQFGRQDLALPWERLDGVEALKER